MVVIYVQFYPKNHGIIHFKWANCMMCELYLNKAVCWFLVFFLRSLIKRNRDHDNFPLPKGHW